MSKLKALAEKELPNLKIELESAVKNLEQAKQSIQGREQQIVNLNKHIKELEDYIIDTGFKELDKTLTSMLPSKTTKKKGKK